MQLTNFTYLQSRNDFLSNVASRKVAMAKIQTGKALNRSGSDTGALTQTSKLNLEASRAKNYIQNLQNASSYLKAQEEGLIKALDIYKRMETLASRVTDSMASATDVENYDAEFQTLKKDLVDLQATKYQGRAIFNPGVYCGEPKVFDYGELNLTSAVKESQIDENGNKWKHAIRVETQDVYSTAGTINFRVNSGTNGDIYRVWLGDTLLMSMGGMPDYSLDHTQDYTYYDSNTRYPGTNTNSASGASWRTSGSADNGDDDLVTLSFGPGIETTYKISAGASNQDANGHSAYNTHDGNGNYGKIYVIPSLPEDFDATDTNLTLQVETVSIGIIYKEGNSGTVDDDGVDSSADGLGNTGVTFTPTLSPLDVPSDFSGNLLQFEPNGFENMEDSSIATWEDAQVVMQKLAGDESNPHGEIECVFEHRLSTNTAKQNRIQSEILAMQERIMGDELAIGRITDADIAKVTTNLVTSKIRQEMATQVINTSTSMHDVLIPLTTNHFRGANLRATL